MCVNYGVLQGVLLELTETLLLQWFLLVRRLSLLADFKSERMLSSFRKPSSR